MVNEFLRESGAQAISFSDRHKAALNFGDCCSYSVAKVSAQQLLYIGNDFAKTDITIA
jgi:uncharacterized protein with PIN domain